MPAAGGYAIALLTSVIAPATNEAGSDRLFYSEGDDIVVRFITNQNTSV